MTEQFLGVIEVSVLPSNFFHFFSTLAYTEGLQFALIRNDGLMLARYPAAPPGATDRLDEHTGFRRIDRAGAARRNLHRDFSDRSRRAAFRLPPFCRHPAVFDRRHCDLGDAGRVDLRGWRRI